VTRRGDESGEPPIRMSKKLDLAGEEALNER
jgi:hypothetical protein